MVVTPSQLIGRSQEISRVEATLAQVAGGRGRAVLLAGEAGIGKTRLAREALDRARARGFVALAGAASPLGNSLAYGLILDLFGPYLRGLDPAARGRLVSGLFDLGRLFADLPLSGPEPLGDPALEKTRLFDAVARLLERLSRETPLALLVDDLHWADAASVELLHYLSRDLAERTVLLLVTYRPDEAEAVRSLRPLLTALRRAGLAEELALPRLTPDAVAELARGLLGGEAPDDLVALLATRAGGTPLFVEAFVRDLIESGCLVRGDLGWTLAAHQPAGLPPDVRDLLLERLDRLEPVDRRVLDWIVVGGGAVPHALLGSALGLDDPALVEALRRLRSAGLIVEELSGFDVVYHLSHPLIQEVAYEDLPEVARRSIHAALAGALERLTPDDLDRLARHYRGAGPAVDPDRALAVFLAAGERARALFAHDEAAGHLGAALGIVRAGRRIDLLPRLLERLGEAWEQVQEGAAAVTVWGEAVTEYARRGEAAAMARLERRIALAEWNRGRFDVAQGHLEAGLAALADRPPSPELADLHHTRTVIQGRLGDRAGLAATVADLEAVAEQLAAPRVRAEALLAQASYQLMGGHFAAAQDLTRRAADLAETAGESRLALRAWEVLALTSVSLGHHRRAREEAERALAIARRLGAPALEILPRIFLAGSGYLAGAWDEALRELAEASRLARRLGQARPAAGAQAVAAMILAQQGVLDQAERCLAEARSLLSGSRTVDRHVSHLAEVAATLLALAHGDLARAPDRAALLPDSLDGLAALSFALQAEVEILAGEAERALATGRSLAALDGGSPYPVALAARVEGLARRALSDVPRALERLARAADDFACLEIPFEAARARLEWAALAAPRDPVAATAAVEDCLVVFDRLQAALYASRARRLLHDLGVRPAAARPRRPKNGPLSPRELEVVRLVTEGLSNPEIGERLVISPRTVTTHLDHIYARLGLNSRVALARYAVEAGLLAQNT